jgi:chorismate synthase
MNSFGKRFRFTSFGESHGPGIGVVIDGCPAGLKLDFEHIQQELDRRRPGQSSITTQRKESDEFEVLSGLFDQVTTGAPIAFWVKNEDTRPQDYDTTALQFRPSHADFTYHVKFGIRDHRGGGRSSARETLARVIAGAVAKQFLHSVHGIDIFAWVQSIGTVEWKGSKIKDVFETEACQMVRCPDPRRAEMMVAAIETARDAGDSLGGVIACRLSGVPAGWGEPIYGKLESELAHAMMGINAVKGFEVGSGFEGTKLQGSEHNDRFYSDSDGTIRTQTNMSGGIQGGISNGEDILFRVAFKPTSTIQQKQQTVDVEGNVVELEMKGRHDPCVVPRAVPIVEAMAAVVLADAYLNSLGRRV